MPASGACFRTETAATATVAPPLPVSVVYMCVTGGAERGKSANGTKAVGYTTYTIVFIFIYNNNIKLHPQSEIHAHARSVHMER